MSRFRDFLYSLIPVRNINKYLIFRVGNCPVIISAPHSGEIKPINIPPRKYGNLERDSYTKTLIERVLESLNKKPYFIFSEIHRSRVDLNRDIVEGCQGNLLAEKIWKQWNYTLDSFKQQVETKYNKGLYIDLHSHSNSDKFQIGYGLSVKEYNYLRNREKITKRSSMYAIDNDSYDSLFGNNSIINTIEKHGFEVLIPQKEEKYLNGGRNIRVNHDEKIGAIQIECPVSILRTNLFNISKTLVDAIETFSNRFLY